MSIDGSAVLKSLKSDSLDDLIRESLQNSLDAAKKGSKCIKVSFDLIEERNHDFISLFRNQESIKLESLKNKTSQTLVISDFGTVGLEGNLNNNRSRISKLCTQFQKATQNESSGGSWGVGKSIYFHMGIGLVGFYSKTDADEKLIFVFIENNNERVRYTINSEGISWWTTANNEKEVCLTKSIDHIEFILSTLKIKRFDEKETGTKIIIPFFSTGRSYLTNKSKFSWENSIENKINYLVQKWYCTRLVKLSSKLKLNVDVNSKSVDFYEFLGFKAIAALRKKLDSIDKSKKSFFKLEKDFYLDDIYDWNEALDFTFENVSVYIPINAPKFGGILGTLVLARFKESFVDENVNNPSSRINFQITNNENDNDNRVFISTSRGSGIIVNYLTDLVDRSVSKSLLNNNEYLLGHFQLNEGFKLKIQNDNPKPNDLLIEKYIRSCENERHTEWNDRISSYKEYKEHKICSHIFSLIKKNINAFNIYNEEQDQSVSSSVGSGLRTFLGAKLLPQGLGRNTSSIPSGKNQKKKKPRKVNRVNDKIEFLDIKYKSNSISQTVSINRDSKNRFIFKAKVRPSDKGAKLIDIKKWNKDFNDEAETLEFPVIIKDLKVKKLIRVIKSKEISISDFSDIIIEQSSVSEYSLLIKNEAKFKIELEVIFSVKNPNYVFELNVE